MVTLSPPAGRARINVAALLIDASSYSFSMAIACHAELALEAGYRGLGCLGALSALLYSLVCLVSGGLSDRLGSMPLVFASIGAISAAFVGGMLSRTYAALLISGGAMGAAPKGRPGCPDFAFSMASTASMRMVLMHSESVWFIVTNGSLFWFRARAPARQPRGGPLSGS